MTMELISQDINIWVSRYIAIFCLLTLLAWGGGSYLFLDKWLKPLRDAATYFVTIGVLTLALAIHPIKLDVLFWPPLTWFCFAMLLVMEIFWLTFLIDALLRFLRSIPERLAHAFYDPRVHPGTIGHPRR